jgi:hypothetical protein
METETLMLWTIAGLLGSIVCVIMFSINRKWDTAFAWGIVVLLQISRYGDLSKLLECVK